MPDRGELTKETADALLKAIKESAPRYDGNATGLRELAFAFALVTGAYQGRLPGLPLPPKD